MAVLAQQSNESKQSGSIYQPCLNPTRLAAFKPSTKAISEFRPIPEVTAKGEILPMVLGQTPAGPDYSALAMETVVVNAGLTAKFTGLCRSLDMEEAEEPRMIFPGIFIRLRFMEKKGTLPAHIAQKAKDLLAQRQGSGASDIKQSYLPRSQTVAFIQGISITENGHKLEKPAGRKAMVLSSTASESLNDLLKDCYAKKIDVFSPTEGYSIIVDALPPDKKVGRMVAVFTCRLGRQIPITEEKAKSLWTPWSDAFVKYSQASLLKKAIAAFGLDIVEVVFPDEVAALQAAAPVTVVAPVQAPAPAKVVAASKPAVEALQVDDGPPQLTAGDEYDDSIAVPPEPVAPPKAMPSGAEMAEDFDKLLKDLE